MLFSVNLAVIWCVVHEDEVLGGGDGPALVRHDHNSDEEMDEEPGPVAFVSKATMDNTTEQLIKTLDHRNRLIDTLFDKVWNVFNITEYTQPLSIYILLFFDHVHTRVRENVNVKC